MQISMASSLGKGNGGSDLEVAHLHPQRAEEGAGHIRPIPSNLQVSAICYPRSSSGSSGLIWVNSEHRKHARDRRRRLRSLLSVAVQAAVDTAVLVSGEGMHNRRLPVGHFEPLWAAGIETRMPSESTNSGHSAPRDPRVCRCWRRGGVARSQVAQEIDKQMLVCAQS